jgi:hypothetical protein
MRIDNEPNGCLGKRVGKTGQPELRDFLWAPHHCDYPEPPGRKLTLL